LRFFFFLDLQGLERASRLFPRRPERFRGVGLKGETKKGGLICTKKAFVPAQPFLPFLPFRQNFDSGSFRKRAAAEAGRLRAKKSWFSTNLDDHPPGQLSLSP